MSTLEVLGYIQNSGLSHALRKSNHLVGAGLQVVHVIGVILLLSSLVVISLRLLRLTFADQNVDDVARDAGRLMWLGLALAVASGLLMFVSAPLLYYFNKAFQLKMGLLLLAVLVQIALLRTAGTGPGPRLAVARTTVGLALFCWFGVGLAGRVIGFL
jgi:hypothetical protein